jgi:hypothetical protein
MTRRTRAKLAAVLGVTVVAAIVLVIGLVDLPRDDRTTISEAEEDRLLATCLSVLDEHPDIGASCPRIIETLVSEAEARGCSYDDAAAVLAAVFRGQKDGPAGSCE